ncbi:hypothetical protein PWW31_29435 [Vibrio harveyi]|nr:hypothetical protein PWW31_29435 [Vibrio harveyi]
MSKVALVVGGGQTLGEFICLGLADEGYHIAVADLNGDNAKLVAKKSIKNMDLRAHLELKSMRPKSIAF